VQLCFVKCSSAKQWNRCRHYQGRPGQATPRQAAFASQRAAA
jgi:hypothetical protein